MMNWALGMFVPASPTFSFFLSFNNDPEDDRVSQVVARRYEAMKTYLSR